MNLKYYQVMAKSIENKRHDQRENLTEEYDAETSPKSL